jgi:hypothetical protein
VRNKRTSAYPPSRGLKQQATRLCPGRAHGGKLFDLDGPSNVVRQDCMEIGLQKYVLSKGWRLANPSEPLQNLDDPGQG